MSDQNSLIRHWPLMVATVLLSTAFAWIFLISIERAVSARSSELSLETGNVNAVRGTGMTLTPNLGALPEAVPVPGKPRQPAPWWPALLYGLAFLCGWGFRHALRQDAQPFKGALDSPSARAEQISGDPSFDTSTTEHDSDTSPDAAHEIAKPHPAEIVKFASGPDLTQDFPWDESAFGDLSGLSSEEQISRLEKQNASKAEIIKALERLVTENREKWLHQDETEARLSQHILELSDDLRVAVRQLQELQADNSAPTLRNHKNAG